MDRIKKSSSAEKQSKDINRHFIGEQNQMAQTMNDELKLIVTVVTRYEFVSFKLGTVKKNSDADCWWECAKNDP